MNPRELKFDQEGRKAMFAGMVKLSDAVGVTLGPNGRNVVISNQYGLPSSTKDGVSVANQVFLEDEFENMGASIIRQAAAKTADAAGDGTTTSTLLAVNIIANGMDMIEGSQKANPVHLKRGIDMACEEAVKIVRGLSQEIGMDTNKIQQVATISSNNDPKIGKLLAGTLAEVGKDGVITVELSSGVETKVEIVKGMQFDRGFESPYFINDGNRMEVVYENPYILICNRKISQIREMLPLLEKVVRENRPLLVIADEVQAEALQTMVANRVKNHVQIVAVKAPHYGDHRMHVMQDIAVITGGSVIGNEAGIKLDKADLNHLGQCQKVIVTQDQTMIIGGRGLKTNIDSRVAQLRTQIDVAGSGEMAAYLIKQLQERVASMIGGIAVMYVGANTEMEMSERRDRVDDALYATKAAIAEGVVPGGGVTYLKLAQTLKEKFLSFNCRYVDERIGIELVQNALLEPFKKILENGGFESEEIKKYQQTINKNEFGYGFNAKTEEFGDMMTMGVIDPTKVVRVAIENACSVAGLFLITECAIGMIKKPKEKMPDNGPDYSRTM